MAIRHNYVSSKADKADESLVRPSDWNDDHVIEDGTNFNRAYSIKSVDYTIVGGIVGGDYYIEVDTPLVTITLPTANITAGRECHVDNSSNGICYVTPIAGTETLTLTPDEGSYFVYNGTKWRVK